MTLGPSLSGIHIKPPLFHILPSSSLFGLSSLNFKPYSQISPHFHIIIALKFKTPKGWKDTFAMVDSGGTHNFIDTDFSLMHALPTYPMSQPSRLLMADGNDSKGGLVSHEILLPIVIGPHSESTTFSVTKLGGYPIVLGLPWLNSGLC